MVITAAQDSGDPEALEEGLARPEAEDLDHLEEVGLEEEEEEVVVVVVSDHLAEGQVDGELRQSY